LRQETSDFISLKFGCLIVQTLTQSISRQDTGVHAQQQKKLNYRRQTVQRLCTNAMAWLSRKDISPHTD